MSTREHVSAAQLERRKANLAKRERRARTWNIVLLVVFAIILITIFAIQISHHI